jgi:predicted ester cyclase
MKTIDKQKLLEQLNALKLFPNNKLVKQLRAQIISQLEKLDKKEPVIKPKVKPSQKASKLRKYHRYLRMIRDNFPDLTYSQIRTQFAKRKRGDEVSIPDAVWQNPSP